MTKACALRGAEGRLLWLDRVQSGILLSILSANPGN